MNSASRLGSTTSNRVTAAPRPTIAARIALGSAAGASSSSAPSTAGRTSSTPASRREPRRHATVDREPDRPPAARALEVADRAAGDQPPVVDDGDRFAQRLGGFHLVGREDERPAAVAQLGERLAQEDEVDRVETGERLVHQQDLGVVQDRRDELDLLLVALGQLLGASRGGVGDPEAPQPGGRLATGAVGRLAVQRAEVDELVEDAHPRMETALLGQVAPGPARQLGRSAGRPSGSRRRRHG